MLPPSPPSRLSLCALRPPLPGPLQSKSERKALFDLGRAEALSWAQEMGFAQAKAKGPKMAAAAVGDDL